MNFGSMISSLFTDDAAVLEEALNIIKFQAPFWFCYSCVNVFPATLRGIGDAFVPMLIICFGTCVLRVIWIFTIISRFHRVELLAAAYPISWVLCATVFIITYLRGNWLKKRIEQIGLEPEVC